MAVVVVVVVVCVCVGFNFQGAGSQRGLVGRKGGRFIFVVRKLQGCKPPWIGPTIALRLRLADTCHDMRVDINEKTSYM